MKKKENPEIQAELGTQNRHKTKTKKTKKNTKQKLKAMYILFTKYDDLFIYIEMNLDTDVSQKLLTCQFYHYLFLNDHIINKAFAPI